ncbi:MAG: VOC family protein [Acidobacteriota bacterium]
MPATLDHLILNVNDHVRSVRFYGELLGFSDEGMDGPFAVVRVGADTTLQLAQRPTDGGEHLAFAMTRGEFDAIFARLRERAIPYGDTFATVGTQAGPGDETGARGVGKAVYFFDPDRHLIEIRHYER